MANSIKPTKLENFPRMIICKGTIDAITIIKVSLLKSAPTILIVFGVKMAVNPKINPTLAIFEPKMVPIGISTSPELIALIDTANSGSEVTMDKIKKPAVISPNPVILAIFSDESDTILLTFIRTNKDNARIVGLMMKLIQSLIFNNTLLGLDVPINLCGI